ncbi:allophanate hydrolase subunit 2-domain-containing protein [Mycena albidolilacea]|uniref:Allophanate hydrolase subunit 2-domain-containing protein n=1 Tax=Mycena albidolilacea TaxID=1033008 RepID=A0AAD6Z343_9AGAR|nr:allophanate hydrolase subunit 2-domain-containing protein [Mycena albidolilacea]
MHKLLVANRGEIALRIIRTAKVQGIVTVAIYTSSDALSPHVTLADEAIFLASDGESESQAYLSGPRIIALCQEHQVTMLHPGYGFLSENTAFAQAVLDVGIIWLGPKPDVIKTMGLKHLARDVAMKAGVTCVPGSEGLVPDAADARAIAGRIGFPVMLKASAGGGGMGMVVCTDEDALAEAFSRTTQRAKELFDFDGMFLERYFPSSRHIEIQIFGNGMGDIVCMGERECSIQRRHQKIIEESPSPFFATRPELRTRMCNAATRLAALVKYSSAGTVEFLVDDESGDFYFLEMNTRIQVEHPVTEAIYPGLDLVRLMIQQGLAESDGLLGLATDSTEMQQSTYDALLEKGRATGVCHAIEARAYAENPAVDFRPCPGVLQYVNLPTSEQYEWLRIDTWISTGAQITPFFDPLLAKVVVSGQSRSQAHSRMQDVLEESQILGSANNVEYLKAILASKMFQNGHATTRFLETFEYIPRAMTVISAAVDLSVQDFPGRQTRQGIPRSGPMDSMAFRSANILVDNPAEMEGLEMIVLPGTQGIFKFHVPAVVAVAGKEVVVKVNGQEVQMWSSIIIPAGAQLSLSAKADHSGGLRTYLAIRGGFPIIPTYLGSKSTSMGFGGFQGRTLIPGDELGLAKRCGPIQTDVNRVVPPQLIPSYPSHCVIYVLAGPHDDEEFVTAEGISQFYEARWRVSPSSNRLGIRLEGPDKILWARTSGGAGGSHPSNILDNGYALGSINVNGNTPVVLTNEGPDMGGYVCLCTVASAELHLGQLSAGYTIEFRRISWVNAMSLHSRNESWLKHMGRDEVDTEHGLQLFADQPQNPKLFVVSGFPSVVLRQAGDSAILVEYGEMTLEFSLRARVHAFEAILKQLDIPGLLAFCPCVRSTMCHFDPLVIKQSDVISAILEAQRAVPESVEDMTFAGRRLTFPIVLDDQWSREALARYMGSIRDKAVYLPSNIDYLAKNNGFASSEQVLTALVASDWLVFALGFYLACPFLVPVDPRCRLVAQKMNPSRTYTPRGAVGIAGVVAAIYPAVSPGGYMLFGRTLPAWQQWGKGPNFAPDRPWLLQPFDQVHFEPVREEQYLQIEKEFDAGRYNFRIEETIFSMAEYSTFSASITGEVAVFEAKQKRAVEQQEIIEKEFLENWELGKKVAVPESSSNNEVEGSTQITSPLFGNVWKICCQPGDVITSSDTTVAVLEAMKTEISITAGEANVGKTVKGVSKGIREGASVNPGDGLIVLH